MQRLSKVIYDITLSPWICLPGFHVAERSWTLWFMIYEIIVTFLYVGIEADTWLHNRILQRLFTKFATSSPQGIGLELYISNIIESHWVGYRAENNLDGKSDTFAFSIPCLTN